LPLLRRSAGLIPTRFKSIKSPQPGRLGKLKHVRKGTIINIAPSVRCVCHFTENGCAPIGIGNQGSLVG
jgi:hypothetical protein